MNAKKLGFGFMRMPLLDPNDQTSINIPEVEKMADRFFEKGFTYCDTAWMYHNFASEKTVGRVVVDRYPRDSFTVASKMPLGMLKSKEDVANIFETQKKNLGIDYFDFYLLHNMTREDYEVAKKFDVFSFVKEKVASGEIRRLGFSVHDTSDYLEWVLENHPEFTFVQLQINYLDWESDRIQSRLNYEVCDRDGAGQGRQACERSGRRFGAPQKCTPRLEPGFLGDPFRGEPPERHGGPLRHEHMGAGGRQHDLYGEF